MEIITFTIILTLLTFASAYCSGSEAALFSLSPMQVKAYRFDPDARKKQIALLLHHPTNLLVTVFMLNTLVNIVLQNVASHYFGNEGSWVLKVGIPLILTLFFGEIIPKDLCLKNNVKFSYYVVPSIIFFHQLLRHVRKATVAITLPISKILFFYLKKEESISEQELSHVLKTSEEHGVLHPEEAKLVRGYLELQNAVVKEIMCPKEDVLYYEIGESLSRLIYLFVDQECSRIPVCRGGLDQILGVITAKNFFLYRDELFVAEDVQKILDKPFYIPETTPIRVLMQKFDETEQVIALVVDEYGMITGLVSQEDIAEVVIGEITDRRDQNPLFTKAGKEEIIASGKLEIEEFNTIFNTELSNTSHMITIGGWLTDKLGEIPKGGSSFQMEGFLFQTLAADPNRIRRIYIRKIR
jgi:putative hemolysin